MVESGKPQICGCHQPGHQESSPIDECVWSGTGCHFHYPSAGAYQLPADRRPRLF